MRENSKQIYQKNTDREDTLKSDVEKHLFLVLYNANNSTMYSSPILYNN